MKETNICNKLEFILKFGCLKSMFLNTQYYYELSYMFRNKFELTRNYAVSENICDLITKVYEVLIRNNIIEE